MDTDFATAWEAVSDAVPESVAIVAGNTRVTYRELDERAARFASALVAAGLGEGSKVALYLYNEPEYLIAQFGAFKVRCVPVNVNYRYLDDELAYLIDNSESEVLVFHSSLGDRVGRVRDRLPRLRLLVEVDDGGEHLEGATRFAELLAGHDAHPRIGRSGRDLYMLYTGGTTGMPKGVMYHHGDFVNLLYLGLGLSGFAVPASVSEITEHVAAAAPRRMVSVPCCPLMHGTGMWVGAMPAHLNGGTVALLRGRSFDAHELWSLVETEAVTHLVIVGDAFARPMLRALEEAEQLGVPFDVSSVVSIRSAGAMWSAEIKAGLTSRMDAVLVDGLGSTEGGSYGVTTTTKSQTVDTAKFTLVPGTRVITEDRRDVVPGSGELGLLASETAAFGYYKDPEKTARTFLELDGRSYVITGDWASVDDDGSVTLLGRGSNCINSGGEKVFPEEVEEALKRHQAVEDCLVVGLPDERFGQRIVAVAGCNSLSPPSGEELRAWLKGQLSAYKIPREVIVVESVRRAPNGKADYGWAKETATKLTEV
ncbi:MAG: acyl-CoA synthetase [Acidimicrobiales bacterium]